MYFDLLNSRRCCFCLLLRPGIIAWGYLKIIADMMIIAWASQILPDNIVLHCSHATIYNTPCGIWCLLVVKLVVGVIFDFNFLLVAHTKNSNLMRPCLYYNIILFVVYNLALFLTIGYLVVNIDALSYPSFESLMTCLIVGAVNAVLQFYIMLLVRSEIRNLTNDSRLTFEIYEATSVSM